MPGALGQTAGPVKGPATWQPTGLAFRHEYSCILIVEKYQYQAYPEFPEKTGFENEFLHE